MKFYLVRNNDTSENYKRFTNVETEIDILFDSSSIEEVKQALCNEVDRQLRDGLYYNGETKLVTKQEYYAVVLTTYNDDKVIITTIQTYYITSERV